ncbi:MAG: hypothetical protein DI534_14365 [Leifsonia xyli]|nr:MAG: hypothetical protein DI534_14365 [Leifsonia xyli]
MFGAAPINRLKVVWLHEFGHGLGLDHISVNTRVMYMSASTAYFSRGGRRRRRGSLHPLDARAAGHAGEGRGPRAQRQGQRPPARIRRSGRPCTAAEGRRDLSAVPHAIGSRRRTGQPVQRHRRHRRALRHRARGDLSHAVFVPLQPDEGDELPRSCHSAKPSAATDNR